MTEVELAHAKRTDQIYRFWRRYLSKYHPEILEKISVGALTPEQILEKAEKMLPELYNKSNDDS